MDDLILKARLFEKAGELQPSTVQRTYPGAANKAPGLTGQGQDWSQSGGEQREMYGNIDSMSGLKETFAAEDAPPAGPTPPRLPAAAPAAPVVAPAETPAPAQRIKTGQGGFFGGVRNIADAAVDSVRAVGRGKMPTANERAISQQQAGNIDPDVQASTVANQAKARETAQQERQETKQNVRGERILGSAGAYGGGPAETARGELSAGVQPEDVSSVAEPPPDLFPQLNSGTAGDTGGDTLDLIEEDEPAAAAAPAVERPEAPQENRGLGGDVKLPGWRRGFDPKTVGATFGASAVAGGIGAAAEYGTNWLANRFSSPTEAKMAKMLYDHQQFQADVGNIREKNTTEAIRYAYR